MEALPLPSTLADLTPQWFTSVLQTFNPGVEVVGVELTGDLYGVGTKVFASLTYEGKRDQLPDSVCVKGGFRPPEPPLTLFWEREARFYADIAPLVSLRIPSCYFAAADPDGGRSIVVMEDLRASGVTFPTIHTGVSLDEVAAVLDQLATLHASASLAAVGHQERLGDLTRQLMRAFLSEENWADRITKPRAAYAPEGLLDRERVAAGCERMWELSDAQRPALLLHGDPHVGNLFTRRDGSIGLLDWQCIVRGPWSHDVSYFITGALPIGERRDNEVDLLRHYFSALSTAGGPSLEWDVAWEEHRLRPMHGFINMLNPEGIQTEEWCSMTTERFGAAIVDHDTLHLLGV